MEQAFNNFIRTATVIQKGVFLMIAGVTFVFVVQFVFFLIVKIWPKAGNKEEKTSSP
jgi:Na+-transporting methylmalonyl-CoA/oxaloacetate decarboxylase gamma subunit